MLNWAYISTDVTLLNISLIWGKIANSTILLMPGGLMNLHFHFDPLILGLNCETQLLEINPI